MRFLPHTEQQPELTSTLVAVGPVPEVVEKAPQMELLAQPEVRVVPLWHFTLLEA